MRTVLEADRPSRGPDVVPLRTPDEPTLELTARERTQRRVALLIVLSIAAGLRLWALRHDLPFSYYGDELHWVKRSMALGTGDLNPHWFNKPAFFMYLLLFVYGLYYLFGRAVGSFASVEEFAVDFLTDQGPFLLLGRLAACLAGIALVYVVWLIGLEVYRRWQPAFLAALATAVLPALVGASQHALSDIPCAFFLALAFYLYLRALSSGRLSHLAAAALAAGVSMGTKYYGVVLVPTFVLWEIWLTCRGEREWRRLPLRIAIIGVAFVLAFFVSSPYHFLDPTWGQQIVEQLRYIARTEVVRFDPDSRIEYAPSPQAWWNAAVFLVDKLRTPRAAGDLLVIALIVGLGAAIGGRKYRQHAVLITIPWMFFLAAAVMWAPYHLNARHLVGVLPLACVLLWPGLELIVRPLPLGASQRGYAALGLGVLALILPLTTTIRVNRSLMLPDSRTAAYRWILDHLPADAGILVEDEGPVLQPSAAASSRLKATLGTIPQGPFTFHEEQRLRLLERFPAPDGRDIWLLGHPWWLPREKTDEALRSSPDDLRIGNPLVSRLPRSLEEYRAAGVRYAVVNSQGMSRTQHHAAELNFPTFTGFYRSLREEAELIHVIDPADLGGKGPVIWIYRLGSSSATASGDAATQ